MSVCDIYISLSDFTEDWDGREVREGRCMERVTWKFTMTYVE